jgi:translation initiation factor 5B
MPIRSPIIVVVGHVDHGKSTLLDKIRQSTVQKSEAGGITQCIGATEIPSEKIKQISGNLLKMMNINIEIPGLLAIDTPGHEAFTNLRRRGGSIADLAILVIDIHHF